MFGRKKTQKMEPQLSRTPNQQTAEASQSDVEDVIYHANEDGKKFGYFVESWGTEQYESFAENLFFTSTSIGLTATSCKCGNHFRRSLVGLAEFEKPNLGAWKLSFLGHKGYHSEIKFRIVEILPEDLDYANEVKQTRPQAIIDEVSEPEARFYATRYSGDQSFTFEAHVTRSQFNELNSIFISIDEPVLAFNFIIGTRDGYVSAFSHEGYFYWGRTIKYFNKSTNFENQDALPEFCRDESDEFNPKSERNKLDGFEMTIKAKNVQEAYEKTTLRYDEQR